MLTLGQAAEYLGVTLDEILVLVRARRIPAFRIRDELLLYRGAIDLWLETLER